LSNKTPNQKSSIPHWSDDDKPREKLLSHGVYQLSDAELLAIILRMGTRDKTAVALARDILAQHENNLDRLSELSLIDLMKFNGVGEAKAVAIKAALELGRRCHIAQPLDRPVINSSRLGFEAVRRELSTQPHEECWVLLLNRGNRLISTERMSIGGISATVIDVRLILKKAIEKSASAMILCHNHPSGTLRPSQSDREITKRLLEACKHLDIKLNDHLIVTKSGYYSFADEGDLI
jgi:DNA repair protein RadC